MSDTSKERESVVIDFSQVGTAGPFPVVNGRVQVPDVTMLDLARMLKPTSDALAAPMPQSAVGTELPDWDAIASKRNASGRESLTPLELFLFDHEPAGEDEAPFRQQLSAVLALAPGLSGWQEIASAPKDGTRFLGWYNERADFFHWQDFRDGGDSPIGWRDSFINVYREGTGPTHWQPITAPGIAPNQPQPEGKDFEAWIDSQLNECDCGYGCPPGCGCRHSGEDQPQPEPTSKGADGWKLVPIKPTEDMLFKMAEVDGHLRGDRDHPMLTKWEDYWNMALDASPAPPASQQRESQEAAENQILRAENDSLRATLDRIAAMDKEGVRADDLGRAARTARDSLANCESLLSILADKSGVHPESVLCEVLAEVRAALSAPQEAGKVEAVADERYADDIACLRGAVSHWRKVLGVDNIEAARKRVHELARPVVLEAIFASLYLRPSQQALGDDAKDAARYRLLRRGQHWSVINGIGRELRADLLDSAVDDVLAAAGGSEK